jgi:hypothetical protein
MLEIAAIEAISIGAPVATGSPIIVTASPIPAATSVTSSIVMSIVTLPAMRTDFPDITAYPSVLALRGYPSAYPIGTVAMRLGRLAVHVAS